MLYDTSWSSILMQINRYVWHDMIWIYNHTDVLSTDYKKGNNGIECRSICHGKLRIVMHCRCRVTLRCSSRIRTNTCDAFCSYFHHWYYHHHHHHHHDHCCYHQHHYHFHSYRQHYHQYHPRRRHSWTSIVDQQQWRWKWSIWAHQRSVWEENEGRYQGIWVEQYCVIEWCVWRWSCTWLGFSRIILTWRLGWHEWLTNRAMDPK